MLYAYAFHGVLPMRDALRAALLSAWRSMSCAAAAVAGCRENRSQSASAARARPTSCAVAVHVFHSITPIIVL